MTKKPYPRYSICISRALAAALVTGLGADVLGAEGKPIAPLETGKVNCVDTVGKRVAGQMHYVLGENAPFDSPLVVCKPSPDEAGVSLVAIVTASTDAKDTVMDSLAFDLDLMKVNSADGKVLSRLMQHDVYTDTGGDLEFQGLIFDTAPYRLAPGIRAFGTRWNYRNDAKEVQELSLFVADGDSIHPLLVIETYSGEGIQCQGDYAETSIVIGASTHHGYADLKVRTVHTATSTETQDCQAEQIQRRNVENYTLVYDGSQYVPAIEKQPRS